MYKAYLFDFDGVVADTESYHYKTWNEAANLVGAEITPNEYLGLKSHNTEFFLDFIAKKAGRELTEDEKILVDTSKIRMYDEYEAKFDKSVLLPGIEEYLQKAKEQGIILCCGSSGESARKLIYQFGLDKYFSHIIDATTDIIIQKPAPDVYLELARRSNVLPSDCIVFEDSTTGIQAAKNANMNYITVGGINVPNAICSINDFKNLKIF